MKNKTSQLLEKIFWVFFIIFTSGLVFCSFITWHMATKNILWSISGLYVLFSFGCLAYHSKCASQQKWQYNIISIFVLSLCVHLFVIWALGSNTEQVSAFASALDASKLDFPLNDTLSHYRIFSNWALYVLYLKIIQWAFGYGAFIGVFFNAIICAISSTLIYIFCHLGFKDDCIGYLAALIYTFWPSHLLYSIILTPEFLNILLTLLFLVLIEVMIIYHDRNFIYILTCLSAMVLSISGFFKNIDKIVLIAIGILGILSFLKIDNWRTIINKYPAKKVLFLFIVFIVCYVLSARLTYAGLDYAYGTKMNRNPAMHYIYIGLNPETYGIWSTENSKVYTQNVENSNYDFSKASKLTLHQLLNEIKEKKYLNPTYFKNKFVTTWANNIETYWVNYTLNEDNPFLKKNVWHQTIYMITQNFWVLICLFIWVEAIYLFYISDKHHMLISLILFGFALLMLITEVQARYKCVMYPIMSILAAEGLTKIITFFYYMINKIKQIISGK